MPDLNTAFPLARFTRVGLPSAAIATLQAAWALLSPAVQDAENTLIEMLPDLQVAAISSFPVSGGGIPAPQSPSGQLIVVNEFTGTASITSPDSSITVGGTPTAPTLALPSSVANAAAQAGLKIPVASGSGGLSWLPETFVGKNGSRYAIVAGPIQNAGSPNYWQPITISNHEPCNIDSIVTTAGTVTAPGTITITHSSIAAIDVVTLLVVPDETLADAGFIAGASVGLTTSVIHLSQAAAVSDLISWNGSAFAPSKTGATQCFTVNSFTTGTLNLTHPPVGTPFGVALEARSLDGTTRPYRPVVAQSAGVGASATNIEFWNEATGTKVTTGDTNCKVFVTRPGFAQVNPQAVDTTAYPNSNLWVFGVFRTS